MRDVLLALLTNIIVIFGWLVVFRQAIHLRRREDIRKTIDLISGTVDNIYDLTCSYYSSNEGHITYSSANLKAKFVLLSHYLILLKDTGIVTGISPTLTAYKIYSTGSYFETQNYKKQEDIPDWRSELAASAQELKFKLEKGYFEWSKRNIGLIASIFSNR
jgi:hypothetical protein